LMQGQKSIDSVIKNLEIADNSQADVIILARGGGSIEDLWTFNELEVAKKVFHMTTPTITAIGHETDTDRKSTRLNSSHVSISYIYILSLRDALPISLMQGQKSIDSVIKNLEIADNSQADVIILARGGGSIEDLWTFNELEVAKKVFHMTTPTITAIGHETDTTLVDYVSDKRATTPTQAIELALVDQYYLLEKIAEDELRLKKLMRDKLIQKETQLESYKNYYKFRMPSRLYDQHIQKLVYKKDQLNALYNTHFNNYQNKYNELNYELKLLTPKNKIHEYRNTNNDFKRTLTN